MPMFSSIMAVTVRGARTEAALQYAERFLFVCFFHRMTVGIPSTKTPTCSRGNISIPSCSRMTFWCAFLNRRRNAYNFVKS